MLYHSNVVTIFLVTSIIIIPCLAGMKKPDVGPLD